MQIVELGGEREVRIQGRWGKEEEKLLIPELLSSLSILWDLPELGPATLWGCW